MIRFFAGPTTDDGSITVLLSLSNTGLSSQEYTFDCSATYNVAYTSPLRRILRPPIRVDLASFRMTAIDVPAIRGTSRILADVFMRKYCVKFDVKECRGELAVECGDDPLGGFSTLSAHQMPARLTSARLQRLRLQFGAKSGKGRVRSHMMWLPHHPRLGKGVERGHMMCLSHLSRICPGKELSEAT